MGYFDDRTYDNILQEVLAEGEQLGVDTRQGSIFYDAVAAACFKIARYYADLEDAFELLFITTAKDKYLDLRGQEFNVYRNNATYALYEFIYSGGSPQVGNRFFAHGLYFVLDTQDSRLVLRAEQPGTKYNAILKGTAAVPDRTITGLSSASFGSLIESAADKEDNEPYRRRIQEKVAGPAQNGNRQHYKTWCEDADGGVGRARIIPLFAGENTVMAVLVDPDGKPAADTVVARVQQIIDPITEHRQVVYEGKTVTMGDGLGNGLANIGAHFAAVAADPVVLDISFTATLRSQYTKEQLLNEATAGFQDRLKEIALDTPEDEDMVVRISSIGAVLFGLTSIVDYSNLLLCGQAANVEIEREQIAVLGEVSIDVAV